MRTGDGCQNRRSTIDTASYSE